MPAVVGKDDDPVLSYRRVGGDPFAYLSDDAVFLKLPLPVHGTQLFGDLRRAGLRLREEQLRRKRRASHSSRGIYPRRNGITDERRGRRLFLPPLSAVRRIDYRPDAGSCRAVHVRKPHADYQPVLFPQRHHVGNGANRGKVDVFSAYALKEAVGILPGSSALCIFKRGHQLEGNADSGKLFERIRTVAPFRIDHRAGRRKRTVALVMVGYDNIASEFLCIFRLGNSGYSGIDRDYQLCAALRQLSDSLAVDSVPLACAAGDVIVRISAVFGKPEPQKRGGGNAVNVVIAVNGHFFAVIYRGKYPVRRKIHILHEKRIGEQLGLKPDEGICLLRSPVTACAEELCRYIFDSESRGDLLCRFPVGVPVPDVPFSVLYHCLTCLHRV